jgi:excisionase family DNA binding protein
MTNELVRQEEVTVQTQHEKHDLLTVDETIRVLRLGRTRVHEILRSGEIPSLKLGRRRLVRRKDLEAWLDDHVYMPGE